MNKKEYCYSWNGEDFQELDDETIERKVVFI